MVSIKNYSHTFRYIVIARRCHELAEGTEVIFFLMGTSKNAKNNITAMFAKETQRSQSVDIYFFAHFSVLKNTNLRSSHIRLLRFTSFHYICKDVPIRRDTKFYISTTKNSFFQKNCCTFA